LFCKEDYECPHYLDISVVEKLTPKRIKKEKVMEIMPELRQDGAFQGIEVEKNICYCPMCDDVICIQHAKLFYSHDVKFCIRCGQALDWSE
jgi:hypothetical protein